MPCIHMVEEGGVIITILNERRFDKKLTIGRRSSRRRSSSRCRVEVVVVVVVVPFARIDQN